MTEDITKLPKWAQWKIGKAEERAEVAEAALAALAGEATSIEVSRHGMPSLYLPNDLPIAFHLESGGKITVRRDSPDVIEVYANTYPGRLAIFPRVSNGFELRSVES